MADELHAPPEIQWPVPAELPVLNPEELHLWAFPLDLPGDVLTRLEPTLSASERERAGRFRFPEHRLRYIASQGTLRQIIAHYADIPADALAFTHGANGKPELPPFPSGTPLYFNLSHSEGLGLCAVTTLAIVGVDVEFLERRVSQGGIAARFFSRRECAALDVLPESAKHEAFLRCWTRKEAFIKALGEGLSHPLDTFDVSLAPGAPAAVLETRPDKAEAAQWFMGHLEPAHGYIGAVALRNLRPRLRTYGWRHRWIPEGAAV